MKTILVIGAGLSSSSLIRYLLQHAEANSWIVKVVDQNKEAVKKKINNHPSGVALAFDALNKEERRAEIEKADLVISMLPARFHPEVLRDCIDLKKNIITPSYVSKEAKALHQEAVDAGILVMNEIGVDPGIDHMSACKVLDEIRDKGGVMTSFKSFCGGLIAPENDDNPWNYKFTWNPRNVVVAGQGGAACFVQNNEYKYIPYNQLFKRTEIMHIAGFGDFEGYANRDSLKYRGIYGLDHIPTIYRGTLRRPGYSKAWNVFVDLGMTDDTYPMFDAENLSAREFLNAFLPYSLNLSVEEKFKIFLGEDTEELYAKFEYLDFFNANYIVGKKDGTPAQILEKILVDKWVLEKDDKDLLVMFHEFEYELNGKSYKVESALGLIGEDQVYTAMSNTVGLPIAICAKLILTDQIQLKGVQIPTMKEVYQPILDELETYGVTFTEKEIVLNTLPSSFA